MTISNVGGNSTGMVTPGVGLPFTVAYTPVSTSNIIVCAFGYTAPIAGAGTGLGSITDTAGNTWHFSTTNSNFPPTSVVIDGNNLIEVVAGIGWTTQNLGAATSVSVLPGSDFSAAAPAGYATVAEFSGVASISSGSVNQAIGSGTTLGTSVTTLSGDAIVGAADGQSTLTITAGPAGWTVFGAPSPAFLAGWILPSTPGTNTLTWTLGTGMDAGVAALVLTAPPPVVQLGIADFGDDERKGWLKKAWLLSQQAIVTDLQPGSR